MIETASCKKPFCLICPKCVCFLACTAPSILLACLNCLQLLPFPFRVCLAVCFRALSVCGLPHHPTSICTSNSLTVVARVVVDVKSDRSRPSSAHGQRQTEHSFCCQACLLDTWKAGRECRSPTSRNRRDNSLVCWSTKSVCLGCFRRTECILESSPGNSKACNHEHYA